MTDFSLVARRVTTARCQACILLAGARDALSFHRSVAYFVYDARIFWLAVRCTVLNGILIFGSVVVVQQSIAPLLRSMLPGLLGPAIGDALTNIYLNVCTVIWILPAYLISLLVDMALYGELAQLAVTAGQRLVLQRRAEERHEPMPPPGSPLKMHQSRGLDSLSETFYRMLLLAFIFVVVWTLDWVPLVGPIAAGVLLAWTYALYCFDYKWEAHGVPLSTRIAFLETHGAYFLGFGFVSIFPSFFMSSITGGAIVGLLFPLFVLQAIDANPKRAQSEALEAWGVPAPGRLPIFSPISSILNTSLRWSAASGLTFLALANMASRRRPTGSRRV